MVKFLLAIGAMSTLFVSAAFAQKSTTPAAKATTKTQALKSAPGAVWDGSKATHKSAAMKKSPGITMDGHKPAKWCAVECCAEKAGMTFKIFVPNKVYSFYASKPQANEAYSEFVDQGVFVGNVQPITWHAAHPKMASKA